MTKMILIRHGHVEGINPERFRGRTELALTERGVAAVHAVARRIAVGWSPMAVYTSPMERCVATGSVIAKENGIVASKLDGLMDLNYGAWQWKTHKAVELEYPQLHYQWLTAPHLVRFPRGESLQDLAVRAADALRFLAEGHARDTVVLVGHESINRVLLLQLLDLPLSAYWRLSQEPCCINEIDIDGGKAQIRRINETAHLSPSNP